MADPALRDLDVLRSRHAPRAVADATRSVPATRRHALTPRPSSRIVESRFGSPSERAIVERSSILTEHVDGPRAWTATTIDEPAVWYYPLPEPGRVSLQRLIARFLG